MNFTRHLLSALALCAVAGASQAAPLTATDSTFATFDASRSTRTLVIGSGASITDVNITIDFAKCDDPGMTPTELRCQSSGEEFASEIFFYLISPNGTRVDLVYTYSGRSEGVEQGSTKAGGTYPSASNVGGRFLVTFDDQAANAAGLVLGDGSVRPEESLAAFNGENALGSWILGMGDSVGSDPLSYFSATLTINADGTVPEPASLALLGLGLLSAGAARRRSRR